MAASTPAAPAPGHRGSPSPAKGRLSCVPRALVLALALAAAGGLQIVPLAAQAAESEPIPDAGLVEIVPPTDARSGKTVAIRVVALDADGAPLGNLKLKPEATAGTASGWRQVLPGLYSFDLALPAVAERSDITVTLRGRTTSKAEAEISATFAVHPTPTLSATSKPASLVLGKSDGGTLVIEAKRDVLSRASAGELRNVTDMGSRKTARFLPPKVNYPHLAIVTFADAADPGGAYGYTSIRLDGSVQFPVDAEPGASVLLKVADGEFGPVIASEDGKAAVPIVVPPGVTKAVKTVVVGGETSEEEIELGIPETRRISMFPLPPVVPADARRGIPVRAVVLNADGTPDTAAQPAFSADVGTVGEATHEGDGVYAATWTLADADAHGTARIEVTLGGKVQVDAIDVGTVPRRAARLTLDAQPGDGDEALRVRVAARSAGGEPLPLSAESLVLDATHAEVKGELRESGDGHVLTLRRNEEGPIRISAHLRPPIAGNPLAHVLLLPGTRTLTSDGEASTAVVVATVDAYGYPVPEVEVALQLEGAGELPESVVTDLGGTATVRFVAGTRPGLVHLRGSAGQASGSATLAAVPEGVRVELPELQGLAAEWAPTVVEHRVGAPSQPAGPPALVLAPADAAVSTLELTVEPERIRPGTQASVRVVALTDDGRAVPGLAFDFLTSAGAFAEIEETDGVTTTVLSVPPEARGPVKVSVIAPDGAMTLVTLNADPTAPEVPILAKTTESAAIAPAAAQVKVQDPVVRPWLRARVSGVASLYSYEQAPSDDPGPMLPRALEVGGAAGPGALPVGFQAQVRGWLPDLPYVGFQGSFRSTSYAIEATPLGGVAPDVLYDLQLDLAGRYPFDVGTDAFWIGAKAGFRYNDFMMFTGCLEPGCGVAFEPLGVVGLGVGPEMGAEIWKFYFVTGYTAGLANFSELYSHTVDVNLGYQITRNAFVDLGFTSMSRRIGVSGAESGIIRGTLSDHQSIFALGGGISF